MFIVFKFVTLLGSGKWGLHVHIVVESHLLKKKNLDFKNANLILVASISSFKAHRSFNWFLKFFSI